MPYLEKQAWSDLVNANVLPSFGGRHERLN
jgi:hypothetical protein